MTNAWTKTSEGRKWKRKYERDHYPQQKIVRLNRAKLRRKNKRAWLLVDAARRRAKETGVTFDLDGFREQIQQRIDAGFCELSGTPFNLDGGRTFDSPSLDRIIPEHGYVYSNIRIVCDLINRALGDYGEHILKSVMSGYLTYSESKKSNA